MATQQYGSAPPINSAVAADAPASMADTAAPASEPSGDTNLIIVLEVMPDGTFQAYSTEAEEPQPAATLDEAIELVRSLAGGSSSSIPPEESAPPDAESAELWDQMASKRNRSQDI
jgi:hypothetical protein